MGDAMTVEEKLSHYIDLINEYGPDSAVASRYIQENEQDVGFVRLANTTRKLKKALTMKRD